MATKGTIGFCTKRRNFISKIIRWFTRSKWSHTYLIRQMQPDILVLEATKYQVLITPINKYESRKYKNVFFVPEGFDLAAIDRAVALAETKIEKNYGWFQLLGYIPVIIFRRLLGMKIKNPMRGGVVCSELVLQYLRGLELDGPWCRMDKDTVSPEDLFQLLESHPRFKKVESL